MLCEVRKDGAVRRLFSLQLCRVVRSAKKIQGGGGR
jgi:hypothetical protein